MADYIQDYAGPDADPNFVRWLRVVDARIESICGVSLCDLEDCAYKSWYDVGMSTKEAAREALVYAGFYDDDDEDGWEE